MVTTGICVMPGEVTHSMWTEVCVSYNCATVPAQPARRCHPGCHPYSPGLGGSGLLPRHDLMPSPVDTRLLAHVVSGARSFRLATGHPTRSPPTDGTAPGTAGSCASASQRRSESPPSHPVRGCRRSMGGRACGSRQPASCRKPWPEPSASTQECPRRRASPACCWQRTRCPH